MSIRSFRDWSMDISSMGSEMEAKALEMVSPVRPFSPKDCMACTPMKKGRASGASQSRVTEPPPGRFRA